MYRGIKIDAVSLKPEIVPVDFEIRGEYIYVTEGGVTGTESAPFRDIMQDYLGGSMFERWIANVGTLNKYSRLEIPMSEVLRFLMDNDMIEVETRYGYLKKFKWNVEL